MNIYWIVLIITAILAILFQNDRKSFVITTSMVHIFVEGFRYRFMHGDLMKYHSEFIETVNHAWTSPEILRDGRNTLFYMLMKFVAEAFHQNFQVLLFIIAFISITSIAIVIYYYSPSPFISFVMWSCFGFYIFSFYSIKQTLAMAVVMMASMAVFEEKRGFFYILVVLAGLIHLPAFVFLPAYELCRAKKMKTVGWFYIVAFLIIFFRRNQIVTIMADVYYDSEKYADVAMNVIGGKTIMLIGLLFAFLLLCDLNDVTARKIFIFVAVASLLQLFSVYDNVFTRLSDYYFQFVILLAPFMLQQVHSEHHYPKLYFNIPSRRIITLAFVCLALYFYYHVNLSDIKPGVDDIVGNFAFMWQVS